MPSKTQRSELRVRQARALSLQFRLNQYSADGFRGTLLQVVTFLQMPCFHYPAGAWYAPDWKRCEYSRDKWKGFRGISAQYEYLRTYLINAPAWPPSDLKVVPLESVGPGTLDAIVRRFADVFRPDESNWQFDPVIQLQDAAVSFAIWQH
jgi:hypothetical protein